MGGIKHEEESFTHPLSGCGELMTVRSISDDRSVPILLNSCNTAFGAKEESMFIAPRD